MLALRRNRSISGALRAGGAAAAAVLCARHGHVTDADITTARPITRNDVLMTSLLALRVSKSQAKAELSPREPDSNLRRGHRATGIEIRDADRVSVANEIRDRRLAAHSFGCPARVPREDVGIRVHGKGEIFPTTLESQPRLGHFRDRATRQF